MNKFIYNYTAFLQKLENKKVFICGDFNVELIKSEISNDTNKLLYLVYSVGQYPLNTMPTRIVDKNLTSIDNIFTNVLDYDIKSNILIDDISEHLQVLCMLPCLKLKKRMAKCDF